ncbi:MAG: hypothetical protein K1060chlam1_00524 [Candidatus Anoxychlamydiales bacterium]|nr:hypothetical protein [Candidatus Anoxychlamydiales bacterium]
MSSPTAASGSNAPKENKATLSKQDLCLRYETIKTVLKVASLALFLAAVGSFTIFALSSFTGIHIINISSQLLFNSSVVFMGLSLVSTFAKTIISRFNKNPQVSEKITEFDLSDKQLTPNMFIKILDKYLSKSKALDTKYIGKIEKIELESGSKLVLKPDIHGDFTSLIKYLKTLQEKGYLDENFEVKEKYKDKIVIAFLGNYINKGKHSFKVLNLLMKLKMLNPNEVVLIRGKHENIDLSQDACIHKSEKHFYDSERLSKKLAKVFRTFPLSVLVSAKDKNNKYQYTCLTHRSLDPDIDLNELLNNPSERAEMLIEKDKKTTLSDRILNILPEHLRNKKNCDLIEEIIAIEAYIISQSEDNKSDVEKLLKVDKITKKRAKQILSILKVQDFLIKYSTLTKFYRKSDITSFSLGEISFSELAINNTTGGVILTPEFIKAYFEIVSDENRKIKTLRGVDHSYKHRKLEVDGKKGFIEILPAAGELKKLDKFRKPVDFAQLITVFPKVRDWKKRSLKRKRAEDITSIGNKKPFYVPKKPKSFYPPKKSKTSSSNQDRGAGTNAHKPPNTDTYLLPQIISFYRTARDIYSKIFSAN